MSDIVDAIGAGYNRAERFAAAIKEARRLLLEERDLYAAERVLTEALEKEKR